MKGRVLAVSLIAIITLSSFLNAQSVVEKFWETDLDVYSIATNGSTVYIGGNFSYVGPRTGSFAGLDASSGNRDVSLPKVNGIIHSIISDGTGGWYIGGNFSSVGGVPRNRVAHIKSDKSVDMNWNPDANEYVDKLVLSGNIVYAAGIFTSIGGKTRNYIAALDAATGNATDWDPNAGSFVAALAVSGSTVYAGGNFTSIGGQTRNRIAALDATTGNATSWNPDANNVVRSILVSGNIIYAGGNFTTINGQSRNRIAAIDASSGTPTAWNPDADDPVQCLAISGSTVYAGGSFSFIGGQTRNNIASLDASTGSATTWNPNADQTVYGIAVSGSTVYAGGSFNSIGGQQRFYLAALDASTGNATGWTVHAGSRVVNIAVSGNMVYVGGDFTSIGGVLREHIAALDMSSGSATSWNPGANNSVGALAVSNNTVYAGGAFTFIGGQTRNHIAALDAATGNVTGWNPDANNSVSDIIVSDNTIYAAGGFTNIGGQARNYIAALNATTGNATSWNPDANNGVSSLDISGNIIYAGGGFTSIGGQTRNYIAALDVTTGNATSWNPAPDKNIYSLAVSGNTVYAGGIFTSIGGQNRNYLAALDATTGNANTWNPDPNSSPSTFALSGNIVYTGGFFTTIAGQTRNLLAAFDASTGNLTSWNPNILAEWEGRVEALSVSGSTLFAGGRFSQTASQTTKGFAALSIPEVITQYTIKATAGNGGTISPAGNVVVNKGDNKDFTITANSGYNISDVLVDGVSQGAIPKYTFTNVTTDHTIEARFTTIPQFTIVATAGEGGSISPEGNIKVTQGGNHAFTITPDNGYKILDVLVDNKSQGAITSYAFENVQQDHTISASFTPEQQPTEIDISGKVTLNGAGIANINVYLWDKKNIPYKGISAITDSKGKYAFNDVPAEDGLQVYLLEPLGYDADQNPKPVPDGISNPVINFALSKTLSKNMAMPALYWAAQFCYHATHKGLPAYESSSDLIKFIDAIQTHYTPHFSIFEDLRTIEDWHSMFDNSLSGKNPSDKMYRLARAELAALVLNIASNKLPQYMPVTMDKRTAGEVLTHASKLFLNGKGFSYLNTYSYALTVNTRKQIGIFLIPKSNILYKTSGPEETAWTAPGNFKLYSNYPNPFNPGTFIQFDIIKPSVVVLKIYDIQGKEVQTLVQEQLLPGSYKVRWDATGFPSGTYIYRITADEYTVAKKMILLK